MRADELLASSISIPATLIEPLPTSFFRMCAPVFAANNIFLRAPPRRLMFPIPSPGNRIYLDISQSRSATRPENSDLVPTRCTCLFHFFSMLCSVTRICVVLNGLSHDIDMGHGGRIKGALTYYVARVSPLIWLLCKNKK